MVVLWLMMVNNDLVGGFNHLEKYESQWEGLSHILWKIKNVPNHPTSCIIVKKQHWIQTCVHAVFLCLSLSLSLAIWYDYINYICAYDFTLKGLLHPKKWTPNTPTTTYLTKGSVSNLSDQSSDSAFPRETLASKIDSLAIVRGNQSMKLSLWWNMGACVCVGTPVPEGTQIKSNLGVQAPLCKTHSKSTTLWGVFCWKSLAE